MDRSVGKTVERLSNQPDRLMRSLMTLMCQVGPNSEHFLPL